MAKRREELNIDRAMLLEFVRESVDVLEGLDVLFVKLEAHPDDLALVDQIFRPVHSIKGNSTFFGLVNIKRIAHALENILQAIRDRKLRMTNAIASAVFEGLDALRRMLLAYAEGMTDTALDALGMELLEKLKTIASGEEELILDIAGEIRAAREMLEELDLPDNLRPALERYSDVVGRMMKAFLPKASALSAQGDVELSYFIGGEDVTEEVRIAAAFVREIVALSEEEDQCERFSGAVEKLEAAAAKEGHDELGEKIASLVSDYESISDSGLGFDDLMAGIVREKFEAVLASMKIHDAGTGKSTVGDAVVVEAASEKTGAQPSLPGNESQSPSSAQKQGKFLRIAEEKVDSFMSYVGELIVSGEIFSYIQKRLDAYPEVREISRELKSANASFNELSAQLQKSLMSVRRIPLRTIMQKLPRMVRDMAAHAGKDIVLEINGDEVQVDKAILDGLEDPVLHMVRNAVDHGIETCREREEAGKSARGRITVSAEATEEKFTFVISDDGRGIDAEAIKKKAMEAELLSPEQAGAMERQDALKLIFGAGVSTAERVTEISGRGVGMDVVMSNISKLNGAVEVESEPGHGTAVRISMPMTVTLMIVDGMVARVGSQEYIIPLSDIDETIQPKDAELQTVSGKGEMLNVRGRLCRMLRLYDMLGVRPRVTEPCDGTVILVGSNGTRCGLLVDEVVGQQSVVLKNLGDSFKSLRLVKGGAILGDGRVGLILDVNGIIDVAARS
ncbi:MAG: chemotaxis protein CheA [Planctomycetes bacterium]|nr:chemotaxis protein CheA [Planctomycetota bacterium]